MLGIKHDADPQGYEDFIAASLGAQGDFITYLPPDVEEKLIELGFDPAIIAAGMISQKWISENYGVPIDLGMYQAIYEREWDEGRNPGPWEAIDRACAYSVQECEAAKWLLNFWKEKGVTSPYLSEDYTNYRGGGAGEFGLVLPSTAKIICEGLSQSNHPDPSALRCEFLDPTGGASAGVYWWLNAIKYKADLSDPEKFSALWGWNHDQGYRWELIERSKEVNTLLASIGNFDADGYRIGQASEDWWKQPAILFLKAVGLWPEGLDFDPNSPGPSPAPGDEWLAMVYKPGTYDVTQGLHGQSYGHCAIDVSAGLGSPVYSPINGTVTQKYVDGYNNPVIRIENSKFEVELLHGIWTVDKGQKVVISQKIGTEASIGNSTGPHTHFHALQKGRQCVDPRDLVNWPPDPKGR